MKGKKKKKKLIHRCGEEIYEVQKDTAVSW